MKRLLFFFLLCAKYLFSSEFLTNTLSSFVKLLDAGKEKSIFFKSDDMRTEVSINVGKFADWEVCRNCYDRKNVFLRTITNGSTKYYCLACIKKNFLLNSNQCEFIARFRSFKEDFKCSYYVALSKEMLKKTNEFILHLRERIPGTEYSNLYVCNLAMIFNIYLKNNAVFLYLMNEMSNFMLCSQENKSFLDLTVDNSDLKLNKNTQTDNEALYNNVKFSNKSKEDENDGNHNSVSSVESTILIKDAPTFLNVDEIVSNVKNTLDKNENKKINISEVIDKATFLVAKDEVEHSLLVDLVKLQLYKSENPTKNSFLPFNSIFEVKDIIENFKKSIKIEALEKNNNFYEKKKKKINLRSPYYYKFVLNSFVIKFNLESNEVFRMGFDNINFNFIPYSIKTLFSSNRNSKSLSKFKFSNPEYFIVKNQDLSKCLEMEFNVDLKDFSCITLAENVYFFVMQTFYNIYNLKKATKSLSFDIFYGEKNLPINFSIYRQYEELRKCCEWLATQNFKINYLVNYMVCKKYKEYDEQIKKLCDYNFTSLCLNSALRGILSGYYIIHQTKYLVSVFFLTEKKIDILDLIKMLADEFKIKKGYSDEIKRLTHVTMGGKIYFTYYYKLLSKQLINYSIDVFNDSVIEIKKKLDSYCDSNFLKIKIEINFLEKRINSSKKRKHSQ